MVQGTRDRETGGGPSADPPTASSFRSHDGLRLHYTSWGPVGPCRASLVVLHGVGEHGGRYAKLARRLSERGVGVHALDQRGHGASGGPRGHVSEWSDYCRDADGLIAIVRDEPPVRPVFVFGHSMGSLVCLELAIRQGRARTHGKRSGAPREGRDGDADPRVAGWIVSGAGIEPRGIARPHLVAVAKLLSGVLPRLSLDLGIEAGALSHDPRVIRAYRDDPAVFGRATVRWGAEALRAISRIKAEAHAIRDPVLLLHGGADPLSDPEGSRWLASRVAGEAELRIYPGALHEPHNDPDCADVAADVIRWIDARLEERTEVRAAPAGREGGARGGEPRA